MTDKSQSGRIRPLARRLDSLAGSPTSMSARPRPTALDGNLKISPKPLSGSPSSAASSVKNSEFVKEEVSVKDMLAQAKRREADLQAKRETTSPQKGARRKQVVRTDIEAPSTARMGFESFLTDTTDDIDLEGNEAVSIDTRHADRCYPVKVPFVQKGISEPNQMVTDTGLVKGDEFMLIQLPSVFPTMVPLGAGEPTSQTAQPKRRGAKPPGSPLQQPKAPPKVTGTAFSEIPDGRIGTLKIHKSGKTVLHVGETQFVVSEGQSVNFRSEVACLCPGENEIIFLGEAAKRLVVSPVINS
jgi:DNA-directed RNA polymerase III subunit RPC4